MPISPWRMRLRPASYNGVRFHVEVESKAGGRRIALHEYPKRDIPYAEDMGRRARRFTISAYVIGPFYIDQRDALIEQLEAESPGQLIHPTLGEDRVACEVYSVIERRERGGFAEFEIVFVEAGIDIGTLDGTDTRGAVRQAVDGAVAVPHLGSTGTGPYDTSKPAFMDSADITTLR